MIGRMKTASRPQRRYDHQLRDLVRRTEDLTVATDLGVPRSTARGWLAKAPTVVISVDVANLTESELRQEILKLRQHVEKLAALLRLALAVLQISGFRLSRARLPEEEAKLRILRAVNRATLPSTVTCRPARSFSRSGSTPCQRRRRPGTASCGGTAGDARGFGSIRPSRR